VERFNSHVLLALPAAPLFFGGFVLGRTLPLPVLVLLVGLVGAVGALLTWRGRSTAPAPERYAEPVARVFNVGGESPAQYLEETLVLSFPA
jgi:hypothetical protein